MKGFVLSRAKALELKAFRPNKPRASTEFRSGINRFYLERYGFISRELSIKRPEGNVFLYSLTPRGERAWRDLRDWTPKQTAVEYVTVALA